MATDNNIIQRSQGHFTFPNGDQYCGEYAIDANNRRIFRHGCGSYVTQNCHIYKGKWIYDKLQGNAYIKYPKEQAFFGSLNSNGDYAEGTFDFGDSSRVCGNFEDPQLLEFQDPNYKIWMVEMAGQTILLTNTSIT